MKKLIFYLFLFCNGISYSQNNIEFDRLKNKTISRNDTIKAKHLNDLSWNAIYACNYDSAAYYIQQSLKISAQLKFKRGISSCYNTLGTISSHKGDLNQALDYYTIALHLLEDIHHKRGMAMIITGMALIYSDKGDYPKALDYNLWALKIEEEINDSLGIASSYNNIGMLNEKRNNVQGAIDYHNKALGMLKALGDTMRMGLTLSNLGNVYKRKQDLEKGFDCYKQALLLETAINNKEGMANAYTNIGTAYMDQDKWNEALENECKALKIWEELGDKEGAIPCLVNIGNITAMKGKNLKAIEFVIKGINLAREIGALHYLVPAEKLLSDIYLDQKDYKNAYEHYFEYIIVRDSILNVEKTKQMLRTEMEYDFEKKQLISKQENDKKEAVAAALNKKRQIIIWAFAGFFLLGFIITLLIVRQNKLRSEQYAMQLEQKLLRSQMNPHFIFNSLTAIESFIYKNEPREAGRYLSGFARLMRLILENSREEFVTLEKEIQTLENYLKLQKLRFDDSFDYAIHISDEIDSSMIEIPPMLAQPFIENAIEHGLKDIQKIGELNISFSLKNDELIFEVQDNGIGFEKASTIKNANSNHKSLATTITAERLKNLNKKKRNIKVLTEDLKNDSNEISGAKVTFTIPFIKS